MKNFEKDLVQDYNIIKPIEETFNLAEYSKDKLDKIQDNLGTAEHIRAYTLIESLTTEVSRILSELVEAVEKTEI